MTSSVLVASAAALALAAAAAVAAPASAQTATTDNSPTRYWYGMLGSTNHEVFSSSLFTLDGSLGARWGWFGVEGEFGWGINHHRIATGLTGNTGMMGDSVGLNNQQTIYALGYLPLTRDIDLFARAGYGRTDWNFKGMGHLEDQDTNWNIGGGGQWFWNGASGIRAEYTHETFITTPVTADSWSVSYVLKF
jgi:outer membrane immunogenic protein